MKREWAPGDVAIVDRGDGVRVRAMRLHSGTWSWPFGVTHSAAEARPLVVIDPEDREAVERLEALYIQHRARANGREWLKQALREFADPKPPIEEPTGLGAVVEDADGLTWLRDWKGFWRRPRVTACWSEVAAVRVLSEGVS